jgi:hypothetical protein
MQKTDASNGEGVANDASFIARATAVQSAAPMPAAFAGPAPFRYEERMNKHSPCPPQARAPWSGKAYRLIPSAIDPKHFVPQAVANEAVLKDKKQKSCCSLHSLSMYESADRLKEKILGVLETQPNYLRHLGDHVVELQISQGDGERTAANSYGHFDFFERTSFDAMAVIQSHWKLVP